MPSYKRIYVGKLPRDVTDREIRRHFDEFGRIREVRILVGFAFVEYEDSRDARDAVEKLDGSRFLGERIVVEPSKVQREDRNRDRDRDSRDAPRGAKGTGKNRLKVENLPSRISWQTLKDLMRKAGEVSFTDIDRDGFGIVEFRNSSDVDEAIKMFDDYEYEGKNLIVKEDTSARSRDDDDDRRGSSSRRRRDSRSPEPRGRRDRGRSASPDDRRRDRDDDRDDRRRGSSRGRDEGEDRSRRRGGDDEDRDRDEDRRETVDNGASGEDEKRDGNDE
ncbi:RNA-binding domain-containing protein [Obelidium mucronatum]|nr:RNA-binding domain-containing protein [Obelidium mucronatum]